MYAIQNNLFPKNCLLVKMDLMVSSRQTDLIEVIETYQAYSLHPVGNFKELHFTSSCTPFVSIVTATVIVMAVEADVAN